MFAPRTTNLSRVVFDKYDRDASGGIDSSEFRDMCYDLGHALSDAEYVLALQLLDANGDGRIEYSEFVSWWKQEVYFLDSCAWMFCVYHMLSKPVESLSKACADRDRAGRIASRRLLLQVL